MASVPQREHLVSTPEPSFPKGKSYLSRSSDCKVSESHTLTRGRGGSRQEHGEEKVDSTVTKGRFQGGERGQKMTSLGEVEGSMSGEQT